MKFGILLHTDRAEPVESIWDLIRGQAITAERNNFDSVWVTTDIGWTRIQPLPLLSAIAAVTNRMTIGTNIIILPLYTPLEVAEAIATADIISKGRVVLGVASGWRKDEFQACGIPFKRRLSRYKESLEIITRLWIEESVTYNGQYFQLENVSLGIKPLQKPHPPIWVGAHSAPAIKRAAQMGLVWCEGPRTKHGTLQEKFNMYREALKEAGKEVSELPLIREAFIAKDFETARKRFEPYWSKKYAEYTVRAGLQVRPEDIDFDRLRPDRFVFGGPEDCIHEIRRYEALGVTHLIFRLQYHGMPEQIVLEAIELFGQKVIPHFKK